MRGLHENIRAFVLRLHRYAGRSWYPPLVGVLAALDTIVIVIPTDGILVSSSMLVPHRWPILAVCVAVGSTLGSVALAAAVGTVGMPMILQYYPGIETTATWGWSTKFFASYGLLLVFAIGASPLMQQPMAIVATLAGTPPLHLAGALVCGRLVKSAVLAYAGARAPGLLNRLWGIKTELKDSGVE